MLHNSSTHLNHQLNEKPTNPHSQRAINSQERTRAGKNCSSLPALCGTSPHQKAQLSKIDDHKSTNSKNDNSPGLILSIKKTTTSTSRSPTPAAFRELTKKMTAHMEEQHTPTQPHRSLSHYRVMRWKLQLYCNLNGLEPSGGPRR